ncbi:MAG: orotidine-5'-phosphate decarboxylase [Candidatus Levybacteria bacterium]|nr:orotidine-5'-phosphate decarboxylase [Candidatus Levybacteria bacterium]
MAGLGPEAQQGTEGQLQEKNFNNFLEQRQVNVNSVLCVGLDPDYSKIPDNIRGKFPSSEPSSAILEFNKQIIDATNPFVCSYKPNMVFYEKSGLKVLKDTIDYIREKDPSIPVIADGKRTDIGNTNIPYVETIFDYLNADAATVSPYFGGEAIKPFLERKNKGIFVLCRTSNKGAKDVQSLTVKHSELGEVPLYQVIAYMAAYEWNINKNICLVVGATWSKELAEVRRIVGQDMPILIPGLGVQGGKPEDIVLGYNLVKRGVIPSISRAIIFAKPQEGETFAQAVHRKATNWRDAINVYRK